MTHDTDLLARVAGAGVTQIRAWGSVWWDLQQVHMTLHARSALPDVPGQTFARRALWEAAVIGLGRTMKNGSRQVPLQPLIDELLPEASRAAIAEVLRWRDKHVAHRQAGDLERTAAYVAYDPPTKTVTGMAVRVAPVIAPPDALLARFTAAVEALRNGVWELRIAAEEKKYLEELAMDPEKMGQIVRRAKPNDPNELGPFSVLIRPTGPSPG
ncbi:MAG: hypothetical protein JHD16_00665 [Solirubrobacteraceae bacterium]|nr:hypothetical protein [Solirubrobacteraceae bacterium]